MKMLSVRLDDAEFAALSHLSEQLAESRSQVVKRGIAELARQRAGKLAPYELAPYELARKLGMIGSFIGRPDLSENVGARVKRRLRAESAARR